MDKAEVRFFRRKKISLFLPEFLLDFDACFVNLDDSLSAGVQVSLLIQLHRFKATIKCAIFLAESDPFFKHLGDIL